MPHGGYARECVDSCKAILIDAVTDARKHGMRCLVGGDFNTNLARANFRTHALRDLANEHGLIICNDDDQANYWTFESCLGIRRKIDFLLVSDDTECHNCEATDDLDLGSDHRAVKACFELPTGLRRRQGRS